MITLTSKKNVMLSLILLVMWLPAHARAQASEYEQAGFYDVTKYELDNGMRVILKSRRQARNVSVRLNVDVGHQNFPCGKQETAHFLEHLLFTGTSKYSEIELDDFIESHGGTWNAGTGSEHTVYELDIFSKFLNDGVEMLHHIITDSTLTAENVARSRKIIFRESGGKPSDLRNMLYKNEIIAHAVNRAVNRIFPGEDYVCRDLDNASSITHDEILDAYRSYYVPSRMTLVMVGDFGLPSARKLIAKTFGQLKKGAGESISSRPTPGKAQIGDDVLYGTLDPVLGTEADVYILYRTEGAFSDDRYALIVLEDYLNLALFNELRVEKGVAYAPGAGSMVYDDYGLFYVSSDAEIDETDATLSLLQEVVAKLGRGELDEKTLAKTKQKLLLSMARGYETNADFAGYYAGSFEEIKRFGALQNYEKNIESVNAEDIKRVIGKYFHPDKQVIAISQPTLTYTQLYSLLAFVTFMIFVFVFRFIRRRRKKGQERTI
ncbi:hypothetical protein MNBD_GAMMA21-1596 [hydrothermal vent metagenome]|uniref:Uncharacterized protein n=1 Tax=hydrothermal vent metagenome TaxID=652676 RepID=A0A3B1AQN6_9ZZZZ